MKSIVVLLIVYFHSFLILAQEVEDFHLNFFAEEAKDSGEEHVLSAKLVNTHLKYNEEGIGKVVIPHGVDLGIDSQEIGTVKYTHFNEGGNPMVEIRIDKNIDLVELLGGSRGNKGMLRIEASSTSKAKGSLVYEMYRMNIGMYDVFGTGDLLASIPEYEKLNMSADESIIPEMLDDVIFVAKAMRERMDSPELTKGRFAGMDLFTAMEKSTYWDVFSFLTYVKAKPYKYMGTDWKFGEIYATWIDGGTPNYAKLESKEIYSKVLKVMLNDWGTESKLNYELKFLNGIDHEILKAVGSEIRNGIDKELEKENSGKVYKYYYAAKMLGQYMNDQDELGWAEYKHAQIVRGPTNAEATIEKYNLSISHFKETENKAALVIVNNDLGDFYNSIKTNEAFKKGIKSLEKAIELSKDFPKDNDVLSPMVGLIYRNLGESYLGLEKAKKAKELFETGLEYVQEKSALALKRKAALEFKISEVYGILGDSTNKNKYESQAILTYKEYEKQESKKANL